MSISAAQYSKFCSEVAQKQCVFTFTEQGGLLIYPVQGQEVLPFWSSRSRLEKIQASHPKYQRYQISVYSWPEFESRLRQMEGDGIHAGVNWSGRRLTGYNVAAADLRAALEYQVRSQAQPAPGKPSASRPIG